MPGAVTPGTSEQNELGINEDSELQVPVQSTPLFADEIINCGPAYLSQDDERRRYDCTRRPRSTCGSACGPSRCSTSPRARAHAGAALDCASPASTRSRTSGRRSPMTRPGMSARGARWTPRQRTIPRLQPRANVGIATGEPSGIFVLDTDPKDGGDVRFEQLAAEHADEPSRALWSPRRDRTAGTITSGCRTSPSATPSRGRWHRYPRDRRPGGRSAEHQRRRSYSVVEDIEDFTEIAGHPAGSLTRSWRTVRPSEASRRRTPDGRGPAGRCAPTGWLFSRPGPRSWRATPPGDRTTR